MCSRYAELLKISDYRSGMNDAARMQELCLGLARRVARTRAKLKSEMSDLANATEGVLLSGLL
jgi:hypothetical protein